MLHSALDVVVLIEPGVIEAPLVCYQQCGPSRFAMGLDLHKELRQVGAGGLNLLGDHLELLL